MVWIVLHFSTRARLWQALTWQIGCGEAVCESSLAWAVTPAQGLEFWVLKYKVRFGKSLNVRAPTFKGSTAPL